MKKHIEIGNRLKKIRGAISQRDFAKKMGISYGSYRNYESGERRPPERVLSKIVDNYKYITVDWILTGIVDLKAARDKERKGDEISSVLRGFDPEDLERHTEILIRIYKEGNENKIVAVEMILSALDPQKNKS